MRIEPPYNPLDKKNLGVSVADALLGRPVEPLPPQEPFYAAGIYAIYYVGDFPAYRAIAMRNRGDGFGLPIYVGKAEVKGKRKGGFGSEGSSGTFLYARLRKHAESIRLATNLRVEDFCCRHLAVDDIWIALGETLLIDTFNPIWNCMLDGFGNNDPGKRRYTGLRPAWDVVHPGRLWAAKCRRGNRTAEGLERAIAEFLAEQGY
jgi:hypothetical protein